MSAPDLSILIPTLEERTVLLERLYATLDEQIRRNRAEKRVEVSVMRDNRERTTGAKRNWLLRAARGRFVASVDDDDDIHPDYVGLILRALDESPDVDCLGIRGEMTFPCGNRRSFVYSIEFREYRTRNRVMQRPPHHLNPIRRSIALAFPYEDTSSHEDSDVAMRMVRSGVLTRERMVAPLLYTYNSRRNFRYHLLLEKTEFVRHPLMLKSVNVLRLKRALRNGASRLTARGDQLRRER